MFVWNLTSDTRMKMHILLTILVYYLSGRDEQVNMKDTWFNVDCGTLTPSH